MSSASERFIACFETTSNEERVMLRFSRVAIFLVAITYTYCRHSEQIVNLNKLLIIGWLFESTLDITATFLFMFKQKDWFIFRLAVHLINTTNTCIFYTIILRFRTLLIYMDDSNRTESSIKNQLRCHTFLSVTYVIQVIITASVKFFIDELVANKTEGIFESPNLIKLNLVVAWAGLFLNYAVYAAFVSYLFRI